MKLKQLIILVLIITTSYHVSGQKETKPTFYYDKPIAIDSTSIILIPKRYTNQSNLSNKWGDADYFANIIFYNYKTDESKKLFSEDTFIARNNPLFFSSSAWGDQRGLNCMLYLVKKSDQNKNGKIDDNDLSILYSSDINGNNLKQLTTEKESVESFNIFTKQDVALIKIRPDSNGDGYVSYEDKEYYLIRLDLSTLTFGNKIELK